LAQKKPAGYAQISQNENEILLVFERVGQMLVAVLTLIFSNYNPTEFVAWTAWLIVASILMLVYEIAWVRYFCNPTLKNFYGSLLFIPVPLASLPIFAFLSLGVYGKVIWLIASTVILGIGHIGIHIQHYKTISKKDTTEPVLL